MDKCGQNAYLYFMFINEERLIKWWPFILTGLTSIGYLSAYAFELGSCVFYQIPSSFITLSLGEILNFCVVMIISLMIVGQTLSPFLFANREYPKFYLTKKFTEVVILVILIVNAHLAYLLWGTSRYIFEITIFSLCLLVFSLFPYFFPILTYKDKREAVLEVKRHGKALKADIVQNSRLKRFGETFKSYKTIIIAIYILPLLSLYVGYLSCEKDSHPYVSGTTLVLVKKYDDVLFFRYYDFDKNAFMNPLIIRKLKDSTQIEIEGVR